MQKKFIAMLISGTLIIMLNACNLPGGVKETLDLELTITALVISNNQQQQQSVEQATATPEFTSTPELTVTPELTATSSIPMVSVSLDTNCRLGPSKAYDNVGYLTTQQQAQVMGKNSSIPNYWVINNPTGSGTCWLWGEYATITGDISGLQEYAVPPTPTPTMGGPKAVENLSLAKTCDLINLTGAYIYRGTLTWDDRSGNEDGFNLYINDTFVEALPPNTTSYTIPVFANSPGTENKFGIESFNAAGKGILKEVIFICP